MPLYQPGEYIELLWEYEPDAHYIAGHVDMEVANAVLHERDLRCDDIRYIYGRWSCEPGPDDCARVLRIYQTPGRGRFKITEAVNVFRHIREGE